MICYRNHYSRKKIHNARKSKDFLGSMTWDQSWIELENGFTTFFLLLAYRIARPVDPELKKAARRNWSKEQGYYIAEVDLPRRVSILQSNCLERGENFHLSQQRWFASSSRKTVSFKSTKNNFLTIYMYMYTSKDQINSLNHD